MSAQYRESILTAPGKSQERIQVPALKLGVTCSHTPKRLYGMDCASSPSSWDLLGCTGLQHTGSHPAHRIPGDVGPTGA